MALPFGRQRRREREERERVAVLSRLERYGLVEAARLHGGDAHPDDGAPPPSAARPHPRMPTGLEGWPQPA